MEWNIVCTPNFINKLKKESKYFKATLGNVLTVEKDGGRELMDGKFNTWFYKKFRANIYKSGEIGTLDFYINYYEKRSIVGIFSKEDPDSTSYGIEVVPNLNNIDSWLYSKLKEIESPDKNEEIKNEENANNDSTKSNENLDHHVMMNSNKPTPKKEPISKKTNKSGGYVKLEKRVGDADRLKNNPGSVSWEDIKEYYKTKNNSNKI